MGLPVLISSQDVDKKDFSLGNGEAEEVDGNLVDRSVKDQRHDGMEGSCFIECLISSTSQYYPSCYWTASTCPSNQGWCLQFPGDKGFLLPRHYKPDSVMVIETPTSFSPFSLTDCTLYSHFSFNDFIRIAFPDLTRDLDNPI